MADKVIDDLDYHIGHLRELEVFLGQVYYSESLGTFTQRPVLSILSSATKHLIDNLTVIKKRYIEG